MSQLQLAATIFLSISSVLLHEPGQKVIFILIIEHDFI